MSETAPGVTFEQCLERLEQIVHALEAGTLPLEESLKVFEEGIALARHCARYLEDAERRVDVLVKDETGALGARPFRLPADDAQ
jgi:exodeoxyribonuclease VII small subunit